MLTICPIAIAVGCKKCPAFSVCPVKSIIGDYRPEQDAQEKSAAPKKDGGRKRASGKK